MAQNANPIALTFRCIEFDERKMIHQVNTRIPANEASRTAKNMKT